MLYVGKVIKKERKGNVWANISNYHNLAIGVAIEGEIKGLVSVLRNLRFETKSEDERNGTILKIPRGVCGFRGSSQEGQN